MSNESGCCYTLEALGTVQCECEIRCCTVTQQKVTRSTTDIQINETKTKSIQTGPIHFLAETITKQNHIQFVSNGIRVAGNVRLLNVPIFEYLVGLFIKYQCNHLKQLTE